MQLKTHISGCVIQRRIIIIYKSYQYNLQFIIHNKSFFPFWKQYELFWLFCRGHLEDVYDICWSPDGNNLISGSVDNSAIIWDSTKGLVFSCLLEKKKGVGVH